MARNPAQRQLYNELLARFSKEIADAFLQAIQGAAAQVDMKALAAAIDAGDVQRAAQIIGLDAGALFPVADAMRGAFVAGGGSVASIAPRGAIFGFNGRYERAESWIAENVGRMVQGIADDTLPMVRAVVQDGVSRGRGGDAVARDITGKINPISGRREGGFIGLTEQQTDAAIRARRELTDLDANYFTRKLRDKRYDAKVKAAIKSGKPLSQTDIDLIGNRYRDKMAKYRGQIIARTESASGIAQGQKEGFQQALDSGRIAGVTKRWQHNAANQQERQDHVYMGSQPAIPIDRKFTLPDGTQMDGPHDPAGGAKHTIGCRCITIHRVIMP